MKKIEFPILPLCVLCHELSDQEHFCYGCRCVVCDRCDPSHNATMGRKHAAEDHRYQEGA